MIAQFQQEAVYMVNTFGGDATLITYTEGTELNGEVVGQKEKIYPVKAALFDYPQVGAGDKANFNTMIQEGDIEAFVLPVSVISPELPPNIKPNSSLLVVNGVTWRIMNTKKLAPNSVDIIVHDLHLRK